MKIIKNYIYNTSYQLLTLIIPLITTPYISRVLGSYGVGINTVTNSTIEYFVLLGDMGINLYGNRQIAYVRDNISKLSESFWEIEILRILFSLSSYAIFVIYILLFPKYKEYMIIQSLNILAVSFDITWFYMGLEDFKKIVVRNIVIKIISIILIFSLVKSPTDLAKYIFIMSASTIIGNMTLWPYLKNLIQKVRFTSLKLVQHIKGTVELFIPQIAVQLYQVLNRTMLWIMISATVSGFYDRSDVLVRMIVTVVTSLSTVMLPRLANEIHNGNLNAVKSSIYKSFEFITIISFPMCFGLSAISLKFAPWFLGKEFNQVGLAIILEAPIIIFIGWSTVIGAEFMIPMNMNKEYIYSVVTGAICNILFNIPLIYLYGLYGGIVSTSCSEFAVLVYQLWIIRKKLSLGKLFNNIFVVLISTCVMFIIVFSINHYHPMNALNFLLEILLGILVYFITLYIIKPKLFTSIKKSIFDNR